MRGTVPKLHIDTGHSTADDIDTAVTECYRAATTTAEGTAPNWLLVFHTENYDVDGVARRLADLTGDTPGAGATAVMGGTSCLGVMSGAGFHSQDARGMGMFAIHDPEGSYGIAADDMGDDPRSTAARVLTDALRDAGRNGEVPALVFMHAAPGHEEALLVGIADVVGPRVPVAGGSSGDNTVSGNWRQLAGTQVYRNAVVLGVLFPTSQVSFDFHSGYDPTGVSGEVTRAEGRTLHEIDGRPAATVYDEWTGGLVSHRLPEGGNVLTDTTMAPFGRAAGAVGTIPFFKLSHPDAVTPDGALTLFTEVDVGDRVELMRGSRESLITRAGRAAAAAVRIGGLDQDSIQGGLVIYCAGCMLSVVDDMAQVADGVREALGGAPFLGVFTFGEQGSSDTGNSHGNLMISVVVFSDRPAD